MAEKLHSYMSPTDLSLQETVELLQLADELKKDPIRNDLAGKTLGCIFFNSSLRTRVSFDVAMYQLGGYATMLNVGEGTWNLEHRDDVIMDGAAAEHIREAAPVMARYTDALAIRAFPKYNSSWEDNKKELIHNGFIQNANVPVINMESSLQHPCQGLADIMTMREHLGNPQGKPIVISWAWHLNPLPMAVTNSVLLEAAKFGAEVRLAHPPGWELDEDVMNSAESLAKTAGGSVSIYNDFEEPLEGAQVIYAKSWGSIRNYGNPEKEREEALKFKDKWQLTLDHMTRIKGGKFMHCLPVRRGVEVTGEVLDSPYNITTDQAENRLHVQKALLLKMLGDVDEGKKRTGEPEPYLSVDPEKK